MGRRREHSEVDVLRDLLETTPWWVGPVVAAALYGVLRLIPVLLPAAKPGDPGFILLTFMPTIALIVAMGVVAVWIKAEISKFTNRRLFDRQTGAASIRQLSWQQFEQLTSEAYRRRGYIAQVVGHPAGDGGIDIRLTRAGQTTLVQCKHWRTWKVGVSPIRELLGVVASQHASRGILVTSGRFTREAAAFAQTDSRIELVNGERLAQMIREVQTTGCQWISPHSRVTPNDHTPAANCFITEP